MARAAQENKALILEVSAAWCGPCTYFAHDIDTHPQYLTELASNGYIMVKGESERATPMSLNGTNDYLPAYIFGFPSFYIFTPKGGWKGIGTYSSYASLKAALQKGFADTVPTVAELKNNIESSKFDFMPLFSNFPANYDYADTKSIIALLQNEGSHYPKLNLGEYASELKSRYLRLYFGIGAVGIAGLAKDFPDVAVTYTDVSSDDFTYRPFNFNLADLWRTLGLKAVASQCESMWQGYRALFVPGKLPAADFQKKLAATDAEAQAICMDLELQATGPTDSLKQKFSQLDKTTVSDWYLLAGLGDVQDAVSVYHKNYQSFVDSYNKYLPSLNEDLQKAKTANDQKRIEQLEHAIDVTNFQIKYHAQVDNEVETALQAGRPVTVLRILN